MTADDLQETNKGIYDYKTLKIKTRKTTNIYFFTIKT